MDDRDFDIRVLEIQDAVDDMFERFLDEKRKRAQNAIPGREQAAGANSIPTEGADSGAQPGVGPR